MKPRYNRKKILDFPWSILQLAVFEEIRTGSEHLMIESVAGSGKTRTIEGIVASLQPGTSILVAAFNRHIAAELSTRIPPSIATVSTAHKIGKMLLTRLFHGAPPRIDEGKYRRICQQLINHLAVHWNEYETLRTESSVDPARQFPIAPPNVSGPLPSDKARNRLLRRHLEKLVHFAQVSLMSPKLTEVHTMAEHYALGTKVIADCTEAQIQYWIYPLVIEAMKIGGEQALQAKVVGLDDLVWLPNILNLKPSTPKDVVILDEAQDSSQAIAQLYRRMAGPNGRIILVGDGCQSIMGFAGASPSIWQQFKQELKPKSCPLNVCYRCPTSHLDLARFFVPDITPRSDAPIGEIKVSNFDTVIEEIIPGDLVICRFNAPLVRACLRLIRKGIRARVRGKNIAEDLVQLAIDAFHEENFPRGFQNQIHNHCQSRIKTLREEEESEAADLLQDTQDALISCFRSFGQKCSSLNQFCEAINQLFCGEEEHPAVVLCSIHRAKGDEAKRVVILGSNLLPYPLQGKQEWQIAQERNLTYVAITRAIETLILVPIEWADQHANYLDHPYGGMNIEAVALSLDSSEKQVCVKPVCNPENQLSLF
ncbi:UvrD-helicase domain-containing protein [Leptolyngbya sp. AN03gr2]|uniref:UvrD-helicase domain-containing protein n=1 Tax=unclassified Leptolyngbya TaxID=2650499 RepID=UPI003D319650